MIRIIQLHKGLFKVIIQQIKAKKSFKENLVFVRNISKSYFRELINIFKDIPKHFDKEYIKKRQEFKNLEKIKKELYQALKMLKYIDNKMNKQGISRQRRRQFWRDFYSLETVRKELFDELLKEVNIINKEG